MTTPRNPGSSLFLARVNRQLLLRIRTPDPAGGSDIDDVVRIEFDEIEGLIRQMSAGADQIREDKREDDRKALVKLRAEEAAIKVRIADLERDIGK